MNPTFKTPIEAFCYWEKNTPNNEFLKQYINDELKVFTYKEVGEQVKAMATALQTMYKKGDHIAILSKNCAHWVMADFAIMMAGCVSIPIYPTLNASSIQQILAHSDAKAVIVGKLDDYKNQKAGIGNLPSITVEMFPEEGDYTWDNLVKEHTPLQELHKPNMEELITIIYTSGTTGTPKGVMHTYKNFSNSANTLVSLLEAPLHLKLFSYLPLAHVAERLMSNLGFLLGSSITFTESLDKFASNLEATQPHIFFAVPRILEKFQEKILQTIPQKRLALLLKIPGLNTLLKNKLKKKLGLYECLFVCSGAAPLAASLAKWYEKLGIKVYQGYGMTEDCCISHINIVDRNKIGTVGKVIEGVKVKFSEEGEICIKNDCLLKGYYKNEALTKEVLTEDGYLKTGDIGEYDHDGYLTITGRVKDQFKTDKGKYISPTPIELQIVNNPCIEQICIVGTGIPQPIALITLSEHGKASDRKNIAESLLTTVSEVNPKLEKHERVEKIIVMKEDWSVENGLATPTLKIKRKNVEKIHQPYYKAWFDMDDKVIFE